MAAPPAKAQATVETLDECFIVEAEDTPALRADCGYVVLPENPDQPDGPEINLAFLRLPTMSTDPKAPLFMLAGGPGDTFIKPETLMLFADAFLGPILDERDVVLLDQRGAGYAAPMLDCPELYGLPWTAHERGLDEVEILEVGRQILAACVDTARGAGIDLAQYNSVRIAADVDAARQALGYDRIVYYGASYGAQLGQHFMRDFPGSLEAVILDGANSLSRLSWVQERVRDADVATEKLAALCAADAKCAEAYDVHALIGQAMDLFEEGPIETTYQDPSDPENSDRPDADRERPRLAHLRVPDRPDRHPVASGNPCRHRRRWPDLGGCGSGRRDGLEHRRLPRGDAGWHGNADAHGRRLLG